MGRSHPLPPTTLPYYAPFSLSTEEYEIAWADAKKLGIVYDDFEVRILCIPVGRNSFPVITASEALGVLRAIPGAGSRRLRVRLR
jgi:hypothetical protein